MIKAMSYSEMANKKLNYQQNVLDVLENYKSIICQKVLLNKI